VDSTGNLIANAKIQILTNGARLVDRQSGHDGWFEFHELQVGEYEIRIEMSGFATSREAIVVAKQKATWDKMLRIQMTAGGECDQIELVTHKAKH